MRKYVQDVTHPIIDIGEYWAKFETIVAVKRSDHDDMVNKLCVGKQDTDRYFYDAVVECAIENSKDIYRVVKPISQEKDVTTDKDIIYYKILHWRFKN